MASIREQVGQLFMIGFDGTHVSAELASLIKAYRPGGIILFARNVETAEQMLELTRTLQRVSLSPLLIAIDQEGGEVVRIKSGATVFPSQMALGATQDRALAYAAGRVSGSELRAMGVNMALAPVLDVNDNPANPVIGWRSYGPAPGLVAELGAAAIRAYRNAGVVPTAKTLSQ